MTEEEFYRVPSEIRQQHFNHKMITPELSDWSELMNDELYNQLYRLKKKASKDLEQRAFDLREQRRKVNNIEVKE